MTNIGNKAQQDHSLADMETNQLLIQTLRNRHPNDMLKLQHMELERIENLHMGHESMHAEMILIIIVTIGVAQVLLVAWKTMHPKSYQLVTLAGMWLIPLGMCLRNQWWSFIFLWLLFSCTSAFVVRKALENPIDGSTPRLVYKWFYFIYKSSYYSGIISYAMFMMTMVRANQIIDVRDETMMDTSILFLFYGLYYGVLGQDLAEISSEKMASHIGYYSKDGIPTRQLNNNVCAVCGNGIHVSRDGGRSIENTYTLLCDHVFHEFCIRGWCIVGKKQICPYCKEKVDFKKIFHNPWEKPHVLYGSLLDWLRVLVAWFPIILGFIQLINFSLGLE